MNEWMNEWMNEGMGIWNTTHDDRRLQKTLLTGHFSLYHDSVGESSLFPPHVARRQIIVLTGTAFCLRIVLA